jgi:hypothetical protein
LVIEEKDIWTIYQENRVVRRVAQRCPALSFVPEVGVEAPEAIGFDLAREVGIA